MTRSGSVRKLLGRSLVTGCVVAVLAAGQAAGAVCPPDDKAPVSGEAAPGTTADPAVAAAPSDSDLYVVRIDPDPAAPGGTTVLHAFVGNLGPDRTASPFTVVITLPAGVTAEGPFFPENCYEFQNGHRVRCTFPAGLPKFRSATALIPLRLSPDVPLGTLAGGYVAVRGDDDRVESNNRQPFTIEVVESTGPRPIV
ncbi:brain acid soluble protein 1 [Kitasatospora purpeofusca]|uniref:hypothetical protein n=1 Tax=Kitasatospora purpeofusca TaxID=67352 RepID=UPI002E14A56C|nr:brain acid soluble protein 1 [Kitasatospora purpeofusca]WSR35483.1 brain acid soluble protein 1 [Kitasatospora purpeofusca]